MAHGCLNLRASCTAFLSPPASLRRWAPSGDLAAGMRMCAMLPQLLHHSGALPPPSLRRICHRQSPAAHASSHPTFPSNAAWMSQSPRCLRRASATPKLPPRKVSAVFFGCGRVSPCAGRSCRDETSGSVAGYHAYPARRIGFSAHPQRGEPRRVPDIQGNSDVRRSVCRRALTAAHAWGPR